MYAICIRHEMDMAHLPVGNFSRAKFRQTFAILLGFHLGFL